MVRRFCVMGDSEDVWSDISDSEFLSIQLDEIDEPCVSGAQSHGNEEPRAGRSPETSPQKAARAALKQIWSRSPLKRRRVSLYSMNPLEYFRRRHLSVTLLCEQSWCEVKVVCGLLRPLDKKAEIARPEVKMGAEIHLKKALEVHEEVPILVLSREDDEAVRALNVMQKIVTLETGMCVREFPVFGVLEGVFVMGFIDELSYDERGQLVLSELKTRRQMSIPRPAQIKRDGLQVRLYMLLFNGMISGSVSKSDITDHLGLQAGRALGTDVLNHARAMGVQADTFGTLLEVMLRRLALSNVRSPAHLRLQYCHQGSGDPIGTEDVPFEEPALRAELQGYLAYWTGNREARGVDIEDAWKCQSCHYQASCEWKKNNFPTAHSHEKP